ncbi:hypothetical protein SDRG_06154 [Saprolegnia diclina VS20]|uniref:Major facilitator superfamily (MFS) profile domain-containing protein n=1 Tax=Saprolegnia diclina (strain VS20) TaxID=1156394 RepID=T0QFJ0_SAPDV|nr:hypothetical protein SDRG_06154 [Saprolegnia diclina VS20]EQC36719.1 hypothetical protein SDRG_06154 [Saprolegnia diclina VS20]|eukprot:XP_008610140.1 hypothetical protein SDRG_06154 [Saprolegnia diclina VS20]
MEVILDNPLLVARPAKAGNRVAWALVGLVLLANLLFSGFIYGWSSLLLFLLEERQYNELCEPSERTCPAQENRLNLIYGVAQFVATLSSLPVGVILDTIGAPSMTAIGGLCTTLGFTLLAVADSRVFDVFVPAYTLLGVGGIATLLTSFRAGFVLLRWQTAILAGVNCLYDASAVMPSLLFLLHESYGFSRRTLLLGCACLAASTYALLLVLWSRHTRNLRADAYAAVPSDAEADAPTTISLGAQIRTFEFRYLLLFAGVHIFRAAFFFGTIDETLAVFGDASYVYTKAFGWILPAGFVFVPVINGVVEARGVAASMHLTTALGVLSNALAMVPILALQPATFVLFTGFRAFLYSNVATCAARTFGAAHLGTLMGAIYTCSALFAFLEIPAAAVALASAAGRIGMYSASLALGLLLVPVTEVYRKRQLRA